MAEKTNAAIIIISKQSLLKLLDFEGGIIYHIGVDIEKWQPNDIQITIEHPDLPEVEPGFHLTQIAPVYASNAGLTYRIDPPKKEVVDATV